MWHGDTVLHHTDLFSVRPDGSVSPEPCVAWAVLAVPMILSIIGTVGVRVLWIFGIFPIASGHLAVAVCVLSGVLDCHHCDAGDLLLVCPEKSP